VTVSRHVFPFPEKFHVFRTIRNMTGFSHIILIAFIISVVEPVDVAVSAFRLVFEVFLVRNQTKLQSVLNSSIAVT
jgi:hypothetical protein